MMQRHQVDGEAQANSPGALRDRRMQHHRRRHDGEARREMNLGEPYGVEAEPIRFDRLGNQIAVALRSVLRVGLRELVKDVEFHNVFQ